MGLLVPPPVTVPVKVEGVEISLNHWSQPMVAVSGDCEAVFTSDDPWLLQKPRLISGTAATWPGMSEGILVP